MQGSSLRASLVLIVLTLMAVGGFACGSNTPLPTYTEEPTDTSTPQPTDASTPAPSGYFGLDDLPLQDGWVVLDVFKGGPMDLAGIKPGDVLLEVDGRRLRLSEFDTAVEADQAIPEGPAGTSATFLVRRASSGQTETIEVTRAALEYNPIRRIESPVPPGIEYPPLLAQSSIESIGGGEVQRGWALRVVSVVPNATDLILAASRSEGRTPTPPEEGKQYFTATISAKYIGAGSDALTMRDLDAAGDATNIVYEAGCGDRYFNPTTIPNALPANTLDQVEVLPGGTIEGVVCWEIDSRDAPTLKMRFDNQFLIVWGSALSGQAYYFPVWYDLSPSP